MTPIEQLEAEHVKIKELKRLTAMAMGLADSAWFDSLIKQKNAALENLLNIYLSNWDVIGFGQYMRIYNDLM